MLDQPILADPHAEAALLGSMLIDPEAIATVAAIVLVADFTDERHRRVYEAVAGLYDRRETVDYVTVLAELRRHADAAEWPATLTALINAAPTSLHARSYAAVVADLATRRRVLEAAEDIRVLGADPTLNGAGMVAAAEEYLRGVRTTRTDCDAVLLRDAVSGYFDQVDRAQQGGTGGALGLPTGFVDLDRVTGGLRRADLVIVAARPSVGKSAWMLNAARHVAGQGTGAYVFSLEMAVGQLVERLVAAEASVDARALRLGLLDPPALARVSEAYGVLSDLPIVLDGTAAPTLAEIRSRARRAVAERGVGVVFLDYLQLIPTAGKDRVREVGEISRALKALARELDVPVVALSQLSRALETRQDKRPMLSDLRDSGAIEQDADVVLALHREEMHNPNTDRRGVADLIVLKNRMGPTASIPLRFFPAFTRFNDVESYRREEREG